MIIVKIAVVTGRDSKLRLSLIIFHLPAESRLFHSRWTEGMWISDPRVNRSR